MLLQDNSIALTVTSPPYNVDKEMNSASNAILIDIYEGSELELKIESRIDVKKSLSSEAIYDLDISNEGYNHYRDLVQDLVKDIRGIDGFFEAFKTEKKTNFLIPTNFDASKRANLPRQSTFSDV